MGNVDVLVISETKLDDSFPAGQFKIPGFASPFRLDRNQNGGGIIVFVREDTPVKYLLLKINLLKPFSLNLISVKRNGWCVAITTQTEITSLII